MEKNWMELMEKQNQMTAILQTNEYSARFGLELTQQDAQLLTAERKNSLQEQRRVEFGSGILPKIIYTFMDSPYISQSEYVQTLVKLQDLFFLYKNEMTDEITDDELLHFMKEQFDTVCCGDTDYLGGTCLEVFAQAIRAGYGDYQDTEGYGAYASLDEVPRWDFGLYEQTLRELEG